tara:strand:- start:3599 stop:4393 length:795 start_codon:yes stop_codon:yes gene_type:complete
MENTNKQRGLIILALSVIFIFFIQLFKAKIESIAFFDYFPIFFFSSSLFFIYEKKFNFKTFLQALFLLSFAIRQNIIFDFNLHTLSILILFISFLPFKFSIVLFVLSLFLNTKLLAFAPTFLLFGFYPKKDRFSSKLPIIAFILVAILTVQSLFFSEISFLKNLNDTYDSRFKTMYIYFLLAFSLFPWKLNNLQGKRISENLKYLGFALIFFSFFNFSNLSSDLSLILFFGGLHFVVLDLFNSIKSCSVAALSFVFYIVFCGIY